MARRFRRRRQVNWLPPQITTFAGDAVYPGHVFSLPVEANGELGLLILPLTWDEPRETANLISGDTSLADVVSSGYFLHRVVGKLFLGFEQRADFDTYPRSAMVAAGMFIARASGDGTQPIDGPGLSYNPLNPDTYREPWLWRRTWWFSNTVGIPTAAREFYAMFPTANTQAASSLDGAHVDAKTKRKVVNDDRLWLAIGTLGYPETGPAFSNGVIGGWFDYRLIATMLKGGRQAGVF